MDDAPSSDDTSKMPGTSGAPEKLDSTVRHHLGRKTTIGQNLKNPPLKLVRTAPDMDPALNVSREQKDIKPEQIKALAKRMGLSLPADLENFLAERSAAQGKKASPDVAPEGGPSAPVSSPALLSAKADRNRIKFAGLLPYTNLGLSTYYNALYRQRGFQLEPHLDHMCLALTDDRIPKLLITIGPGSGKSLLISTVYPGFRLGTDSSYTILGLSAGEALMQGFQSAVMETIEHSPVWKAFFPNVRPDKGKGWSTERGMFVKGHPEGDPDASYLACGLTSKRLTGVHARLIIGDDLHDEENSYSADSCMGVRETFYRQIIGRADPRGARFVFAGRRWHEEDLYGHLERTGEWVVMNLPAMREDSEKLWWDVIVPDGLECCFTEMARGEVPSNLGDVVVRRPE